MLCCSFIRPVLRLKLHTMHFIHNMRTIVRHTYIHVNKTHASDELKKLPWSSSTIVCYVAAHWLEMAFLEGSYWSYNRAFFFRTKKRSGLAEIKVLRSRWDEFPCYSDTLSSREHPDFCSDSHQACQKYIARDHYRHRYHTSSHWFVQYSDRGS